MELEKLHTAYVLRNELTKVSSSKALPSKVEQTTNPHATTEDATKVELSSSTSQIELYKHIKDHYSGKGYLSKETGIKLSKETASSINQLTSEDPENGSRYSGYLTANFTYGTKARFVNQIDKTIKNSNNIRKAYQA